MKYQEGGKSKLSFEQAYRAARDAGKKTFKWNGKNYNTTSKSEAQKKKTLKERAAARKKHGLPDWNNEKEVEQYYKDNPIKRGSIQQLPEDMFKNIMEGDEKKINEKRYNSIEKS